MMNTQDEYSGSAKYYDLVIEPFLHGIRKRLAAWMEEQQIARALDIGCGTGKQISMSPVGTESLGIDLSESMLHQAHKRVPGRCRLGNATDLPFEDEHFDMVYTQFALHEKSGDVIEGLLKEARRVLRPAGSLVVVDYTASSAWTAFGKVSSMVIAGIEKLAGQEHYANYQDWMSRGGIDRVLSGQGWRESSAQSFYGGTIKMGVFRPGAPSLESRRADR